MKKIVQPLILWYDVNKRPLPWREKEDPYVIWISEIMLQQTRVEAVKPYYQRFIKALPQISDLAKCPEEQLLKLWEGLGYYNRVRNMQKAANQVIEQYDGVLPADYEALKGLSGIGSYTAGAIASIAYKIPVPAVDGNVLRVLARLRADDRDITKGMVRRQVEMDLLEIMPQDEPGKFNQALMELGATVCVPNGAPFCDRCPLADQCEAAKAGTMMEYPVKGKAKARRIEQHTILVILDGSRAAICKRPAKGLLAGLYEFPNLPGHLTEEEVLQQVKDWGLAPLHIRKLPDAKHIFSHVEWHMTGYAVRIAEIENNSEQKLLFAQTEQVEREYPLPAAYASYAGYLNLRLGQEKYEDDDK